MSCAGIIFGNPYLEPGASTYVGYLSDPETATPAPNQVYYTHIVVGAVGNPCPGQIGWISLKLPPNTAPAVSGANPVYCFRNASPVTCSQSPSSDGTGHYFLSSGDNSVGGGFLLPTGHTIEIQVPVVSTTPLASAQMSGKVVLADGNNNPR